MHDGCSGGMSWAWRALLRRPPPWEACCDAHDYLYAQGGPRHLRRAADALLWRCVRDNGHPLWAWVMWAAVRIGGSPAWPTKWRWGFERPFGHGYRL